MGMGKDSNSAVEMLDFNKTASNNVIQLYSAKMNFFLAFS